MHHFEHPDGHINHNADLSGEVQIINSRGEESWVSGPMLVAFIADFIRQNRRSPEDMDDDEIMGLRCPKPITPE